MRRLISLSRISLMCALSAAIGCDAKDDDFIDDGAAEIEPEEDSDGSEEDGSESGDDGEDDDAEPQEPAPDRQPQQAKEGSCDEPEAAWMCPIEGGWGMQYCDEQWGPCIAEPACELGDTQERTCGFGEVTTLHCFLDNGVPAWEECGFTPLVLTFDGKEPTFDTAAEAFELSAGTQQCYAQRWPSADTPWLAIDLDQSGAIEHGGELFGSASPTASGTAPDNGFEALAVYDHDNDGRITPADPVWDRLLLWSDHDRDRQSSAWELAPLRNSGLAEITLDFHRRGRCEAGGACGIERSAFTFSTPAGVRTTGTVIDLHIPCD